MAKTSATKTSSSQIVPAGVGVVKQIIVHSHTSGVIRLVDSPNGSSGRAIFDSYTLPSGAQIIQLDDAEYYQGVWFNLDSGTATVSVIYQPTSSQ